MDNEVRVKVVVDDAGVDKGFQDVRTKSDKAGEQIVNDANKRLRDSKGRFVAVGKELGDSLGGGLGDGIKRKGPETAEDFTAGFLSKFSGGIGPLGPMVSLALVAAAPLIGATMSAAVIGGAGIGGILGGVLIASKDPQVKAAGKSLGESLLGELKKDARPFIEPVLDVIAMIEVKIKSMGGTLGDIFGKSSAFLKPLAAAVLDAFGSITKGIDALVTKGKPVMDALGGVITDVGQGVQEMFEIISGGGDGAAKALQDIGGAIRVTLVAVGYLIRGLTELYDVMSWIQHPVGESSREFLGWDKQAEATNASATVLTSVQKQLGVVVLSTGEAAGQAGLNMQTFGDEMTAAASKGRGFYDSQTAVAEALDSTRAALKKNKATLDINTEAGRANRNELSNLAGQMLHNYDAQETLGASSKDLAKTANGNREQFIKLATQFTHNKKKAEELATEFGLLPVKTNLDLQVNTHDAAAQAIAVRNAINSVKSKSVTLRVNVAGDEALHGHNAHGGLVGAASGGARNGLTMVGEYGPELVELPAGTRVHSNPDTQRLMGGGMGGGKLDVRLYADRSSGNDLLDAILAALRLEIRSSFQGDVQMGLGA